MSEQYPKSHESSQPKESSVDRDVERRFPTEAELEDFELHREIQGSTGKRRGPWVTIEEFAVDPTNPTADEIAAVEHLSWVYGPKVDTFEEYFGYPDPREQPDEPELTKSADDR
ncbi:hypothetical protein ACFWUU_04230 [Kribbella sp. NPDC058693]|uniref:hypothetical protein n=1 Tax=Kribbella sp. NPDC058693 TaxID=3346602 RepID=UPI0036688C9F